MNLCYSVAKAAQGAYSKVLALGNFCKTTDVLLKSYNLEKFSVNINLLILPLVKHIFRAGRERSYCEFSLVSLSICSDYLKTIEVIRWEFYSN